MSTVSVASESTNAPLPPQAPGLPILGNALDMLNDPLRFFLRMYQQLGPVFRVKAMFQHFTVMIGMEAQQMLTRQEEELFSSDELFGGMGEEIGSRENLASLHGERHRHLRKIMRPGFSRDLVVNNMDRLVQITDDHLAGWSVGQTITVLPAIQRLVMHQLGAVMLNWPATEYVNDISTFVTLNMHANVMKTAPRWLLRLPTYRRAKQRFQQLEREIVEHHRANPPGENRARDLVDDVIDARDLEGKPYQEGMILSAAVSPYIAGQDTVASTLGFLIYAILKHPEVLKRVQAEVDEVFSRGTPAASDLKNMPALHGTAMETLRMYPIAFALPRKTIKSFTYAGHQINAGSIVMIGTGINHYLPEYFPNPEQFNIDRYDQPRKPGTYNPYGLGAHTCLGAGVAEIQIALCAATILHRLRLELDPKDYNLRIYGAPIPNPGKSLRVRVIERRH
jgi:cytochrome P450